MAGFNFSLWISRTWMKGWKELCLSLGSIKAWSLSSELLFRRVIWGWGGGCRPTSRGLGWGRDLGIASEIHIYTHIYPNQLWVSLSLFRFGVAGIQQIALFSSMCHKFGFAKERGGLMRAGRWALFYFASAIPFEYCGLGCICYCEQKWEKGTGVQEDKVAVYLCKVRTLPTDSSF